MRAPIAANINTRPMSRSRYTIYHTTEEIEVCKQKANFSAHNAISNVETTPEDTWDY
jgi:hypothetical protein